jgi:hypothetical protein
MPQGTIGTAGAPYDPRRLRTSPSLIWFLVPATRTAPRFSVLPPPPAICSARKQDNSSPWVGDRARSEDRAAVIRAGRR